MISCVSDSKSGHAFIYDMIETNERLQKYVILRMVATLRNTLYKGKSPFDNGMKDYFDLFWHSISENKKKQFLEDSAGE